MSPNGYPFGLSELLINIYKKNGYNRVRTHTQMNNTILQYNHYTIAPCFAGEISPLHTPPAKYFYFILHFILLTDHIATSNHHSDHHRDTSTTTTAHWNTTTTTIWVTTIATMRSNEDEDGDVDGGGEGE
jgi:hypothetical protein